MACLLPWTAYDKLYHPDNIGLRIGAPLCLPHTCCHCGKDIDHYGHHGLSCRSSQGKTSRHQTLNEIIHRSLTAAKVNSRLEPSGLYRADGKCPDGVTTIPWSKRRSLVWDAACVDTFCNSLEQKAAQEAGGTATHAENMHYEYACISACDTRIFCAMLCLLLLVQLSAQENCKMCQHVQYTKRVIILLNNT